MVDVASPGHKLGQIIGNFFQDFFADDLIAFCGQHGFYCDRSGPRPAVRGSATKVSWTDNKGNKHDLDYVVERGGSYEKVGEPVAFIELAWRRYTKHSRNKTGELEGALLPLRESYQSCRFLGAILAGEYTDGGKNQLTSHGITVLHVPFQALAECFRTKGIELDYPEKAGAELKRSVLRQLDALSGRDMNDVRHCLREAIEEEYSTFKRMLERTLLRKVEVVRILPLYGTEQVFSSVRDAIEVISQFQATASTSLSFIKFEIQLRFDDGDKIEGTFHDKEAAVHFLSMFV